jgi:hypothetical protein
LFGGVLPFLPESFADLKGLSKLFLAGGHATEGYVILWMSEGSGWVNYGDLADC